MRPVVTALLILLALFVMHELDGRTLPEIAEELTIPLGTATTRLRLAREDLEAALKRLKASERGGAALGSLSVALLLDAGREVPPLPPGMSDRVLARLQAAPGAPGPGASPESGPVRDLAAGALKQRAALLSRIAAGARAALLIAAGIAVGALWRPLPSPPPPSAIAPAAVTSTPQETMSPAPSAAASASADVAPGAGTAPRAPDDEAEERALMRKASGALASGDAARALAEVEEHARRFRGGGRHAEEREGYRILALVSAGRRAEAKERFERFAQSYPASTRLDGLRGAVEDGVVPR